MTVDENKEFLKKLCFVLKKRQVRDISRDI